MTRIARTQRDGCSWAGDGAQRSAGRRNWASSAWLVAGTIAAAVTSYSLSLKVAAERRDVERMARQNSALETDLKALDAELRVRMRMPQLQRWNDTVLGLVPINASQYLANPVQLAAYGDAPAAPSFPRVQLAVRDVAPLASKPVPAPIPVDFDGQAAKRSVQTVSAPAAIVRAPVIARPAAEAPADLLQQVELEFGGTQPPTP